MSEAQNDERIEATPAQLDEQERKRVWKNLTELSPFKDMTDAILQWHPAHNARLTPGNYWPQLEEDADFRRMAAEISKWFPPVYPKIYKPKSGVITNNSEPHERLLVEYYAECFKQEMTVVYNMPNLTLQFDAMSSEPSFRAWLALSRSSLFEDDGARLIKQVVVFTEDAPEELAKKYGTQWVMCWVWTPPRNRGIRQLENGWSTFEKELGKFLIRTPLSPGAQRVIDKLGIDKNRLLPERQ